MALITIAEQSAPSTPSAGNFSISADTNTSMLATKNDAGVNSLSHRPGVTNTSTAAQAFTVAVETIPTNAQFLIPSWGLVTGAAFRFDWSMSKTAAGTVAPTFNLKIGSAGTTADVTRFTITGPAQTAAVDTAQCCLMAQLRAAGATAVLVGTLTAQHTAASAAGFGFTTTGGSFQYQIATSAAFDSTTAVGGWFVSMSLAPGASAVWTVDFGIYQAIF